MRKHLLKNILSLSVMLFIKGVTDLQCQEKVDEKGDYSMKQSHGLIFILSAPTGVGKSTVSARVLERIGQDAHLKRVITYTSRPQRPGEVNGKDYFFISKEDFLAKKEQRFFLETNQYDGNWYGSPASIITDLDQGISYLTIVDRAGMLNIIRQTPRVVTMWLTVSDFAMIEKRLISRTPTTPEKQRPRIMIAQSEWRAEQQAPLFTYHITNDDRRLEQTVEKVCMIIQAELGRRA